MRKGIFGFGGALAAIGAVLAYWTPDATKKEHVMFGIYRDVPMFEDWVPALMIGVLVIGIVLMVYGAVAPEVQRVPARRTKNQDHRAEYDSIRIRPMHVILPLALGGSLWTVIVGIMMGPPFAMVAFSIGMACVSLGLPFEPRYRRFLGVLLFVASIPAMYLSPSAIAFLGPLAAAVAGVLAVVVSFSRPSEQEHVGEDA